MWRASPQYCQIVRYAGSLITLFTDLVYCDQLHDRYCVRQSRTVGWTKRHRACWVTWLVGWSFLSFVTCICLRRTLCARFSGERRTVTSSLPQLICLSCITWQWKKHLDEQWSRNLDYERWYLYRCSLYAPCGIFADYEFRFVLQLSQTVAQYNSTTVFCNLWWHSCTVIFVGNNNKIH